MYPALVAGLVGVVIFGVMILLLVRARSQAGGEASGSQVNRRKEPRVAVPVDSEFDLFWQDVDASHKSARARGIEISEHGACVRSPRPILCNSVIQIRGRQIRFEGRATVRRCTKKGLSYIIGLEVERQQDTALRA